MKSWSLREIQYRAQIHFGQITGSVLLSCGPSTWTDTATFIIQTIVHIHDHRYEIYTLVSDIHYNVDLVQGIKDTSELEGIINS